MSAKSAEDIWGLEYDWIAVDAVGHVGFFSTAGAGYAPKEFLRDTDAYSTAIEAILALPGSADASPTARPLSVVHDTWRMMAERGVFAFDSNPNGGPYLREAVPKHPIRVEELPAEAATVARRILIEGLRFSEVQEIDCARLHELSQKGAEE
ncbi:hypothetical protein [Corallococcus silvisoli]|uniref:hypothetical protein n=1 Tax=Corallococcus silvisoli TaxID=2697031 RepID=UPI001377902D|nr:hypothetical protein [Corallococcus silvisoli]NBD12871.1 hypothetical protein [Corallococcus silvisoli]